jgi:hypothetical protein
MIVIIISELSLDGWESWENIPVKFSNVNYPQTKDNNAPQNFFVAIFCYLYLLLSLNLLEEKKMYFEGNDLHHQTFLFMLQLRQDLALGWQVIYTNILI